MLIMCRKHGKTNEKSVYVCLCVKRAVFTLYMLQHVRVYCVFIICLFGLVRLSVSVKCSKILKFFGL